MTVIELISGGILIVLSVLIIAVTISQTQKQQGMTSAVGGSSANTDSFYGKHGGNTKEKALERLTKIMSILFFILILAVNFFDAFASKAE